MSYQATCRLALPRRRMELLRPQRRSLRSLRPRQLLRPQVSNLQLRRSQQPRDIGASRVHCLRPALSEHWRGRYSATTTASKAPMYFRTLARCRLFSFLSLLFNPSRALPELARPADSPSISYLPPMRTSHLLLCSAGLRVSVHMHWGRVSCFLRSSSHCCLS